MTLGLKDLYYAVCTEADGAESYGKPKKMAEAMSADLSVKTADGSLYADDTLSESVTEFASGTLKPVSYTHLDVYKRQGAYVPFQ